MSSFEAMGSALMGRLGTVQYTYLTNGTAPTTGTLPTYDTLAPQGTNPPYVVYQLASSLDGYVFERGDRGESMDWTVKVVSDRLYPSMQAFGIFSTFDSHLQDAPLSVMGYQVLRVVRTSRFQYQDEDKYWHVGGMFRIDIWT